MSAPHPPCPNCQAAYGEGARLNFMACRPAAWAYGNPTTFGQQAEINAKRMGKEQLERMAETTSPSRWDGKLPDGARHVPRQEGATPWWRDGSVEGVAPLEKPLDTSKITDVDKYVLTGKT